jgi:hypothetical protein
MSRVAGPIEERFYKYVAPMMDDQGCHEWLGYRDEEGYGKFRAPGEQRAHRTAYILAKGPIPEGLVLDHLCRNTSCVNPNHLEAVTHAVNMARGINSNRIKTHCKRGHEYTLDNTYMYNNARYCRECNNFCAKRRYALGG